MRVFSLASREDIDDAHTWNPFGQDIVGDANNNNFGASVSLPDDGKTLAVGADYAEGKNGENLGRVSVYGMDESESNWIQIGDFIDGVAAGDISGSSVSLSANSNMVAIGSPWNDDKGNDSGHGRVYVLE